MLYIFHCQYKQVKGTDYESVIEESLEFTEDRPFNDLRYPMTSSKLHDLGWRPEVTWQKGLEETGTS